MLCFMLLTGLSIIEIDNFVLVLINLKSFIFYTRIILKSRL